MVKRLSVIIPLYNCEQYIGECLDSLTRQGFNEDEYEVIVVNDGSTDASPEIVAKYCEKYPYIKLVTKENGGVSSARNVGMAKADCRYIAFVDADDYVSDNIYIPMIDAMEKDRLVGFYYDYTREPEKLEKLSFDCDGVLKRRITKSKWFSMVYNNIYDASLIEKSGLKFDETMIFSEDFLFNTLYTYYYMKEKCYVAEISDKLYYYRPSMTSIVKTLEDNRGNSDNAETVKAYLSCMRVLETLCRSEYSENGDGKLFINMMKSVSFYQTMWYALYARQKTRDVWKEFKKRGIDVKRDVIFKNREGSSFTLRVKSEIQYLFRHKIFFDFFNFMCCFGIIRKSVW